MESSGSAGGYAAEEAFASGAGSRKERISSRRPSRSKLPCRMAESPPSPESAGLRHCAPPHRRPVRPGDSSPASARPAMRPPRRRSPAPKNRAGIDRRIRNAASPSRAAGRPQPRRALPCTAPDKSSEPAGPAGLRAAPPSAGATAPVCRAVRRRCSGSPPGRTRAAPSPQNVPPKAAHNTVHSSLCPPRARLRRCAGPFDSGVADDLRVGPEPRHHLKIRRRKRLVTRFIHPVSSPSVPAPPKAGPPGRWEAVPRPPRAAESAASVRSAPPPAGRGPAGHRRGRQAV